MYGARITDIKFHSAASDGVTARRVVSADTHIIKVWDVNSGAGYTSMEPEGGDINDVAVWPGSGLLMAGCDCARVQVRP